MRQEQARLFERMCEVISILADTNRELCEVLAQYDEATAESLRMGIPDDLLWP